MEEHRGGEGEGIEPVEHGANAGALQVWRGITAALRLVARAGWREASQNHRSVVKTPPRDHKALVTLASLIQDVDYG